MGRTIHYLVEDDGQNRISEIEWQRIAELQEKYNRDYSWTCEQLCLERFSILPNWTAWEETGLRVPEVWKRIHAELKRPGGMGRLLDLGLIEVDRGGYRGSGYLMSGFTKVREDESNAALVIQFLQEASRLAPEIRIRVHDEGDYLACPIIIQNGQMQPDKAEIQSHICYWNQRLAEAPAGEMEFWTGLIARQRQFLDLEPPYQDQSIFITLLTWS